ncbi:hypothetical protein JIR23_21190 [Bradyrhizobium diazoefficiens]|nr:hypothetical protein [Bradyrhizobium diazoefficiens]QQN62116.1 hypothetical protein JIR23_21190 [Bradyrhizobium diazoefficiens]
MSKSKLFDGHSSIRSPLRARYLIDRQRFCPQQIPELLLVDAGELSQRLRDVAPALILSGQLASSRADLLDLSAKADDG